MRKLTADQRESLARQAQEELIRRSYAEYFLAAHHGRYQIYPHHQLVIEYLQRIADGEQLSLIVEMPPRHGKSAVITETFESFFALRHPDKRIIATAYSDHLARKFGRLNRDKFKEFAPLFGLSLSTENFGANNWSIEGRAGGMISTGIGGSLTGEGADLMIIDDPIKNAEAANSPAQRQKIWDEWESTLSTRLHDGASIIVVMTRWNEDDLVGRLLENKSRDWIRIRLPAIAEEDDLLGREEGEALWAEKYDEKWAEQKKIEVGSRTWSALYQQRPAPSKGTIFFRNWFKYYKALPKLQSVIISWDMTFKDEETSDYVVGQVWGKAGAEYYLIDQVRAKMSFPATVQAVRSLAAKHPAARTKLVEDKANGTAVIATLRREISGIIPINPQGGKIVRAQAVSPLFEAGNVYLPDPSIAPWVHDYVEELVVFPNGKHDDQVDSTTQALTRLAASNVQALSV